MRPLAPLLALVLALSVVACGDDEPSNTAQDAQEQTSGATQEAQEQGEDAQEEVGGEAQETVRDLAGETDDLRRELAEAAEGGELDADELERLAERAGDLRQRVEEDLPGAGGEQLGRAAGRLDEAAEGLLQAARAGDDAAIDRARERLGDLQPQLSDAADELERRFPGARDAVERLREPVGLG